MAQLSKLQSTKPTPADNALRAAKIFFGAGVIISLIYGYLVAFYYREWQLAAVTGLLVLYSVIALVSIFVIRRGYANTGVWLLIAGMFALFVASSALIAGFGLILGLSVMMLTVVLATQTLPGKQTTRAIIGSVLVVILTALMDTVTLDYRLHIPQFQWVVVGVTAGVVLVFIYFVVRQFAYYSLRVKLIVTFLLVSLLSVAAVASFSLWTTGNALVDDAGHNTKTLAEAQALNVGSLLARQLDSLKSLTLNQILRDRLVLINANYRGGATAVEAKLNEMEDKWVQNVADGQGPLLSARLNNSISDFLREFQRQVPEHTQLFITDKYGGLLATTALVPDYNDADELWWQQTFNNGQGRLYISQPTVDEDAKDFGIIIGIPIYGDDGAVIGVLRSKVDIASLVSLVTAADDPTAGLNTLLLFPSEQMLSGNEASIVPTPPDILADADILQQRQYGEFEIDGQSYLISQATVSSITGEPVINELNWAVLTLHNRAIALVTLQTQQQNIIVLAVIIATVVVGAAVFMSSLMASPIVRLTETARQVAGGDLTSRASVETNDEVGVLAANFNSMADQLGRTIDSLEDRVADRTQQLTTVVDVSQRLSSILDLGNLMRQVVTLTKETFNYYHVHIYLLDEVRAALVMAEGYGTAGVEMKRAGHSIAFDAPRSLVARAARQGHIITVDNVREDPNWLPNALLPDTHSESAIPVMLGDEVVGVLDVQSEQVGGITADDEVVLQALANQVAIAVRNARLFAETQSALVRAQQLQKLYTGEAWLQFSAAQPTDFEFRQAQLPPLEEMPTPEVSAALEKQQTVELSLLKTNGSPAPPPGSETNVLATPLKLRGQVIGVLGLRDANPARRWTEDEIALIEAVSEQMSLAIENARLFDETGRRAGRERIIANITQQVWASGELEKVMQTAVEQLGTQLDASKVVIRLGTKEQLLTDTNPAAK